MNLPAVYAILDIKSNEFSERDTELLSIYLKVGFEFIQIRAKHLDSNLLTHFCCNALQMRARLSSESRIIVNDDVEVARISKADGVHLGQEDVSPIVARAELGKNAIIGLSTHTREQASKANRYSDSLNYIALGPIFESGTKSGHAATTGCETLAEVCGESKLPIVAIGGITIERAAGVYASGAKSIALIGELERASTRGADALHQIKESYRVLLKRAT